MDGYGFTSLNEESHLFKMRKITSCSVILAGEMDKAWILTLGCWCVMYMAVDRVPTYNPVISLNNEKCIL